MTAYSYNGCTIAVEKEWPTEEKIKEILVGGGCNAAYILVANGSDNYNIGYYNSLGERSFYGIGEQPSLKEGDYEGKQTELAAIITAAEQLNPASKGRNSSGSTDNASANESYENSVSLTPKETAVLLQDTLNRIEKLMHHQHIPIYQIPIKNSAEKLTVRITPETKAVAKSHDQEASAAQPQYLSYLIDTAQEQQLYWHLSHKGVGRTTATVVSVLQKSVADFQGDVAIKKESLKDYWQKTWGFEDSSEKSLEKIEPVVTFMKDLNQLTLPFTELESLINNAPKDNPLSVLTAAIATFEKGFESKIEALTGKLLDEYAKNLLSQFLTRAQAKITTFKDRIAYLEAITPDSSDIMRLFCAQNLSSTETASTLKCQKVFSLGKFENNVMEDLLDTSIDIVYALTDDRIKQSLIKNPAVKHLAAAKESVRLQGSLYGARDVNTREVIPESMLQRQRLCAMDTADLASCQYREVTLEAGEKPTLQTLSAAISKITGLKEGLKNAAYVVVGEELYYINRARAQCASVGNASQITGIEGLVPNTDTGLTSEQLTAISKATGHSTQQFISSQSLVSFAGDLSEHDQAICVLTGKKYHGKETYLSQHAKETHWDTAYRIGHGVATVVWWPVALGIEVAACAGRVGLTILSSGTALVSTEWADNIDLLGQKSHEWVGDTWGYAATQRAANQYYHRIPEKINNANDDATKSQEGPQGTATKIVTDDHQAVLTAVAHHPDKLFSNIANHYLSGSSTVRIMKEQIQGIGQAIYNIPYEIAHTVNSTYEKMAGKDWLTEPGLDGAIVGMVNATKSIENVDATANSERGSGVNVSSEAPENLEVSGNLPVPVKTNSETKAKKAEREFLEKFAAMNAYFEELQLRQEIAAKARGEGNNLPIHYDNRADMGLMRKADTDSILDFVDEVFVKGLCHTLINEMFNEAPLVSAVMFALSLASFGIMTGFIAGPAALTYLPGIIGKSFTGQVANTRFVSASAANFLQFKLADGAFIGLSKIYELDFKFLKSLGNHPEALLAFAALTAIGYGIGCLGHLPSTISVANSPSISIEPLVMIPNAISPEAHEAIIGGVIPLISIELAFIGLKSLLFLDALASGRHHPDICATRSCELLDGIINVLLLEDKQSRRDAILYLLEDLGVPLSEAMMENAVVKQFFDNIETFKPATTVAAKKDNLTHNSSVSNAAMSGNTKESAPENPAKKTDANTENAMPSTSTPTFYKRKTRAKQNHITQKDLKAAHAALTEELKVLQCYEAKGIKVSGKDQERVYNHLDALYDQYNYRCRQQGRYDLQLDKSAVLHDFLMGHCYKGMPMLTRIPSSMVGLFWRPIKIQMDSPFIVAKAKISYAKDALLFSHASAIIGEMARSFNMGVTLFTRFTVSGFGLGALGLKGIDAARNWYHSDDKSTLYQAADAAVTHYIDFHNLKLPGYEQRQIYYADFSRGADKNSNLKATLAADLTTLADVAKKGVVVYAKNIRPEDQKSIAENKTGSTGNSNDLVSDKKAGFAIDAATNSRYTRAALRQTAIDNETPGQETSGALIKMTPAQIRNGGFESKGSERYDETGAAMKLYKRKSNNTAPAGASAAPLPATHDNLQQTTRSMWLLSKILAIFRTPSNAP